jgi:hypothetical protein
MLLDRRANELRFRSALSSSKRHCAVALKPKATCRGGGKVFCGPENSVRRTPAVPRRVEGGYVRNHNILNLLAPNPFGPLKIRCKTWAGSMVKTFTSSTALAAAISLKFNLLLPNSSGSAQI